MRSKSPPAILQALLAALLFGLSAPLSKLLLKDIDPIPLAGFLYLGSGIGSALMFAAQRSRSKGHGSDTGLTRKDWPWLTGAVIAGGVGAPILLLMGLNQTPASTASLLLNFESVATTLIAFLVFKEAVNGRVLGAVGLVTAGCILLSWTGGRWGVSIGALAILAACSLWGLDNNFTRQISASDPILIVAIKGLGAGAFSLLLTGLLGKPLPGWGAAAAAMLVGAVSYGLSIQLFILALRELGAARTSALFATAPFVGTTISILFLRERPQLLFWISVPLMLLGVWLIASERHQHMHIHEPIRHSHPHEHDDPHHRHEHPEESGNEGQHVHEHEHSRMTHEHPHTPDIHHRHEHASPEEGEE